MDNKQVDLTWKYLLDNNSIIKTQDIQQDIFIRTAQNLQTYFTCLTQLYINKPQEYQIHNFDKPQYQVQIPLSKKVFPRSKPIPEAKQPTKWQKFAKEKGITKKKRSRKVFDQVSKQWVPRWGARSIKKIQKKRQTIKQAKQGVDDIFQQQAKKRRISKDRQQIKQLKNKCII